MSQVIDVFGLIDERAESVSASNSDISLPSPAADFAATPSAILQLRMHRCACASDTYKFAIHPRVKRSSARDR